jgi:hypothetical protein
VKIDDICQRNVLQQPVAPICDYQQAEKEVGIGDLS